jgi:hypothetical protein
MTKRSIRIGLWLVLLGFIAVSSLIGMGPAYAQEDQADPWWDSETCLVCHDDATLSMQLPSGEQLNVGVLRGPWLDSIHAEKTVQCRHCHSDKTGYPHGDPPASADAIAEALDPACETCHLDHFGERADQVHGLGTLLCTNCHDPHATQAGASYAAACSECHEAGSVAPVEGIHALPEIGESGGSLSGGTILLIIGLGIVGIAVFAWLATIAITAIRQRA